MERKERQGGLENDTGERMTKELEPFSTNVKLKVIYVKAKCSNSKTIDYIKDHNSNRNSPLRAMILQLLRNPKELLAFFLIPLSLWLHFLLRNKAALKCNEIQNIKNTLGFEACNLRAHKTINSPSGLQQMFTIIFTVSVRAMILWFVFVRCVVSGERPSALNMNIPF